MRARVQPRPLSRARLVARLTRRAHRASRFSEEVYPCANSVNCRSTLSTNHRRTRAVCSANKTTQSTRTPANSSAKLFVISADSAAFFHRGPQARREPDKTLTKETVVKLIRPSFGYSKVEVVATGELGYVASEEIRPATSALLASVPTPNPNPLETPSSPSTESSVEHFNLDSSRSPPRSSPGKSSALRAPPSRARGIKRPVAAGTKPHQSSDA